MHESNSPIFSLLSFLDTKFKDLGQKRIGFMFGFGLAGYFLFNQIVMQPLSGKFYDAIDELENVFSDSTGRTDSTPNSTDNQFHLIDVRNSLGVYGGKIDIGHDTHKVVCQSHDAIKSVLDWQTLVGLLKSSNFWKLDWADEHETHEFDDGDGSYAYTLKDGVVTVFATRVSEFKAQISMESPLTWPEKGPRRWLDSKLTINKNSINQADLRTTCWIPEKEKLPSKSGNAETAFKALTDEIHNGYLADWEPWLGGTAQTNSSLVNDLESLISMKESGAITETEFLQAKDRLFNS